MEGLRIFLITQILLDIFLGNVPDNFSLLYIVLLEGNKLSFKMYSTKSKYKYT